MPDFNTICGEYPFIEDLLRSLKEGGYPIAVRGNGITIDLIDASTSLRLGRQHLDTLENGKLLTGIKQLRYHHDCGLTYRGYSEFLVSVEHPDYLFLDLDSVWPAQAPLRFMIDSVSVVAGPASPLLALLLEPHFRDSDIHQDGFSALASIRLHGASHDTSVGFLHKAMYYMNSHYLRPTRLTVGIHHLESSFEDPLGIYYGTTDPEKVFKKIVRRRVRRRTDLISTEPLVLYNHACRATGAEAFLSFYRVLEFFFQRSILAGIEALRQDSSASARDILEIAVARNEEQRLLSLIQQVLTPSQRKKLPAYVHGHAMIGSHTVESLARGMYAFRNSVVHAKEQEAEKTTLPDPFLSLHDLERWTYVVNVCADRSIRTLNHP